MLHNDNALAEFCGIHFFTFLPINNDVGDVRNDAFINFFYNIIYIFFFQNINFYTFMIFSCCSSCIKKYVLT